MSRATLSLYTLDRPALKAFAGELEGLLRADDRAGLGKLLELGPSLVARLGEGERAVDWLLRPETRPDVAPFFSSLRRVAKKRALSLAWTSDEPSLEGRLRQYDVLREEAPLAKLVDRLLDSAGLPWFLVRRGATGGWLDDKRRVALADGLGDLAAAMPPEIVAFTRALEDVEGDVLAHDGL